MGHIRDSNADQNQPLHRLSWNVRNSGCEEASAAREIQHVAIDLFLRLQNFELTYLPLHSVISLWGYLCIFFLAFSLSFAAI